MYLLSGYVKQRRQETNYIIIHSSLTKVNKRKVNVKSLDKIHKQNGWLGIGYHFVILRNGTIQTGRDLDHYGAHTRYHNDDSVGVCLIGGLGLDGQPEHNYSMQQMDSLESIVKMLLTKYPNAKCVGHNDLHEDTNCPCFNVDDWFKQINLNEKTI